MIGQMTFTICAFIFFVYIVWFKVIRKNDTAYITILLIQAIGIFLNLIKIRFEISNMLVLDILLVLLCIIIPSIIILLEWKKVNTSEVCSIIKAKAFIVLHNEKKAKRILEQLVKKYDQSYMGHKMLGNIYENEGGMRKAIDEYVKALEIKKDDYDTYYKIAVLLNDLGKKNEAVEMLNTLLKRKHKMYEVIHVLGKIYLEQQQEKQAIETYTNALKYYPEDSDIYYNIGLCYARINDFNNARKNFQKAIQIDNGCYLGYYKLGQIALLYRDLDTAEENFKKSWYNEKEAKSYFQLAKIHMMKDEKEKAINDIDNLLKIDTSYYNKIEDEPIFMTIMSNIEKPKTEIIPEEKEDKQEEKIDEYLDRTYNITKILSGKNNI